MKYLVDSDWVADYLKGRPAAVSLLQSLAQEGIAISILTYGEIFEGIIYGPDRSRHELGFRSFLRGADVVSLNQGVMRRFAGLRGLLRQQGQLIGDMDLLITATAIHHRLILVTRNRRHFERIPALVLYS